MFCGKEIPREELTMEHFVPKGLWEKGHRPNGMRTLPAHKTCNGAYSEDNEYFRDVFVLDDGAQRDPAAARVQQGALQRKIEQKPGSIAKVLKNLGLKLVQTKSGIYIGLQPGFEINHEQIARVLVNVMKGIFYLSQGQPMPQDFIPVVFDVRQLPPEAVLETSRFMVPWQGFGDTAFACRYVVSSKLPIQKMTCLMSFYGNRIFLGEVVSPLLLGKDGNLFVPARIGGEVLVPNWAADR